MKPFLSQRQLVVLPVVFFGSFVLANRIIQWIDRWYGCYCPVYWPVMILPYTPSPLQIASAVVVLLTGWLAFRNIERWNYSLVSVVVFGIGSVLATNLLQGFHFGYRFPIIAGGSQYYNDAIKIRSAWNFLSSFQSLLPGLANHSQTHPPGAVLFFYVLDQLLGDPVLIAVAIGVGSVLVLALLLYGLLSHFFGRATAGLTTLLFVAFPATQIYVLASLDAVVAVVFLAAVYFFVCGTGWRGFTAALLSLLAASTLNYAFLFLLPVMGGYELLKRFSLKKTTVLFSAVAVFYVLLFMVSGFNYGSAFVGAFVDDRPGDDPFNFNLSWYFPTRLQNVACLIFFLGPLLMYFGWRGLRSSDWMTQEAGWLGGLGLLTILSIYATGLYRDGVTSRNCFYVYPYLFLFVALGLKNANLKELDRGWLFVIVFGQSVVMQIVGSYVY